MIKSLFFVLRIAIAWFLVVLLAAAVWSNLPLLGRLDWPITIAGMITMALVVAGALSHLARVQLIAGSNEKAALANRQRRQIEIPLEAGEAFDLLDAAIRELPRIEQVESARDSLQVRAKVGRPDSRGERPLGRWNPLSWFGTPRNQVLGCELVTGAGDVVRAGGRVVKNVAGFDVTRLMVGAWGTLGALTEVTVRLRARPEVDEVMVNPVAGAVSGVLPDQAAAAAPARRASSPTSSRIFRWS